MTRRRPSTLWLACTLVAAALTWAGPVAAAELVTFAASARSLAMGGALTAVAEGFDAMLHNPAGLALDTKWHVEFRALDERSYDSGVGSGNTFFNALAGKAGQPLADADTFLNQAGKLPQTRRKLNLVGFHTGKGFGIAHFDTTRLHSDPNTAAGPPSIDVSNDRVSGEMLTYAFASKLRLFMWGFSLKYLTREGEQRNLTPADISAPDFDLGSRTPGRGDYVADLGIMWRMPVDFLRPTLGIALLNAGAPVYDLPLVERIHEEVNVGISFMPIFSSKARLTLSAEKRDTMGTAFPTEPANKLTHYGAELSLFQQSSGAWLVNLRAGSNQGLNTLGVGFALHRLVSLDIVNYREQVGTEAAPLAEERWLFQVNLGL